MRYDYSKPKSKQAGAMRYLTIVIVLLGVAYGVYYFWPVSKTKPKAFDPKLLWQKSYTELNKKASPVPLNKPEKEPTDNNQKTELSKKTPTPSPSPPNRPSRKPLEKGIFSYITENQLLVITQKGQIKGPIALPDNYQWDIAFNGHYLYQYQKTGDAIHLWNNRGRKLWSQKTKCYPRISPKGEYVLLITADSSHIALWDRFQSKVHKELALGIGLTSLSWAGLENRLALSFLDGSFVIAETTSPKHIVHKISTNFLGESAPPFVAVKSLALSWGGRNLALQVGHPTSGDFLFLYRLPPVRTSAKPSAAEQSDNKRPKEEITLLARIPLPEYNSHSLSMDISSAKDPLTAVFLPQQGLQIYNTEGDSLSLKSLLPEKHKEKPNTSSLWKKIQQNLRTIDNNRYVDLRFGPRNDLFLLFPQKDQSLNFHILHWNDKALHWNFNQNFKNTKYGRALFYKGSKNVLVQTDRGIFSFQLYLASDGSK